MAVGGIRNPLLHGCFGDPLLRIGNLLLQFNSLTRKDARLVFGRRLIVLERLDELVRLLKDVVTSSQREWLAHSRNVASAWLIPRPLRDCTTSHPNLSN